MSIVLCVVVVGSCIAVIARWAGKAVEPATPPPRRARAHAAVPGGREAVLVGAPAVEAATAVAAPTVSPVPTPAPVAPVAPEVEREPEPEPVPESEPEPEVTRPVPVVDAPRPARRPSPAEVARRQLLEAGRGVPPVRWWHRLRAAAWLTFISVTLGLLAAASIGLVLFGGYTALKSL